MICHLPATHRRSSALAVFAAFFMILSAPVWSRPANDNFATPRWLQSVASFNGITVDVAGATPESNEPVWSSSRGTIWFAWKAPQTGIATFFAAGFNSQWARTELPTIRIGQGNSLNALSVIGRSHSSQGIAKIRIPVLAGQWYRIQLENGYDGRYLTLYLNGIATINDAEFGAQAGLQVGVNYFHVLARANDNFAQGAWLGSLSTAGTLSCPDRFSATASSYQVSKEDNERVARTDTGTVWFNWVAPRTGIATFEARGRNQSNEPTAPYLRIGQGSALSNLAIAAEANRTSTLARLRLPVLEGQLYRIQVENSWNDGQTVTLNLTGIAGIEDPEFGVQSGVVNAGHYIHALPRRNDYFASGEWVVKRNRLGAWSFPVVYPDRFSATASTLRAPSEPGEKYSRAENGTVWFNWVAPRTGIATFEALGRDVNHAPLTPKIRVGQGTRVEALPLAGVSRTVAGLARLQIPVQAGQSYKIQVENGWSDGQTVTLNLTGIADITNADFGVLGNSVYSYVRPGANDSFASAAPLWARNSGGGLFWPDRFSATASSLEATPEPGEKVTQRETGTVWFRWVAPRSGVATFEALARETDHDPVTPVIRVGQGADVADLRVAGASRSVSGLARLQIPVQAWQTYYIQVENYWIYDQTTTLRLTGITPIADAKDFGVQADVAYFYVPPGTNNDYDAAFPIPSLGRFSAAASTWEATSEPGETVDDALGSVWFRWVAPRSGTATFEATGRYRDHTLMKPQLRVGQGSGIESFALSPGTSSTINQRARYVLNVRQGQVYRIQVANEWHRGQTVTLNLVSLR
jgi:hypothetical protein